MAFVVSIVPVTPIRKEAAHRTEMVSQLLFGEVAEVLQIDTSALITARQVLDEPTEA